MDGLRVMPVVNIELVYAISPLADEIWHEHYDSIIGEAQVDYMLEKFLSTLPSVATQTPKETPAYSNIG